MQGPCFLGLSVEPERMMENRHSRDYEVASPLRGGRRSQVGLQWGLDGFTCAKGKGIDSSGVGGGGRGKIPWGRLSPR